MSEMISAWGWPQFLMAAFWSLTWASSVWKHGEPQPPRQPTNAAISTVVMTFMVFVLYSGGFWTPGRAP